MNWLEAITAISTLLPGAIHAVEQIHGASSGEEKSSAVKTLVGTAAVGALAADQGDAELIKGAAAASGPIIDGIVSLLNTFGVFKHKTPAPAPTPVAVAPVAKEAVRATADAAPSLDQPADDPTTPFAQAGLYEGPQGEGWVYGRVSKSGSQTQTISAGSSAAFDALASKYQRQGWTLEATWKWGEQAPAQPPTAFQQAIG